MANIKEFVRYERSLLASNLMDGMQNRVEKIHEKAKKYKPAKVRIEGKMYVLKFDPSDNLFKVYDEHGNELTSELGMGAGMNTRKLSQAKKDLKEWLAN